MPSKVLESLLKSQKYVSAHTFKQLLSSSGALPTNIVAVDATWFMPNAGKTGFEEFKKERIPGSVFLDIDEVKDEKSPFPHMMPSKSTFDKSLSKLGLSRDDLLIVYDKQGNFSAPRALWMLRAFNHTNSLLLNSFPVYKNQLNGPIETSAVTVASSRTPTNYESTGYNSQDAISYEELKAIVENESTVNDYYILDARPNGRFTGTDPEPRPGISSGHVPGAISVPFNELVKDGQFVPTSEITQVIQSKGIANDKPIIVMCGTGVTACVIENALKEIDGLNQPVRVYDGSWT